MLRLRYLLPLVSASVTILLLFIFFNSRTDQIVADRQMVTSQATHIQESAVIVEATETEIRQRQYRRRGQVQNVCEQNGLGQPIKDEDMINPDDYSRIYVDDQYKILYCEIPKVACTNWKRILLILTGKMNTSDAENLSSKLVHTTYQSTYLRTMDSYKPKQILNKLLHYYKFMFVREPFERLVSAYRNKMKTEYNIRYQQRFGRKIVQRYRKMPSSHSLEYGDDVKFGEFVQFLLDPRTKRPFDAHWRPYNQLCHPCSVQYDFVGKYETLDEDVDFVLQELQLRHLVKFPKKPKSHAGVGTVDVLNATFSEISPEQFKKLWKLYHVDYEMFGYPYPTFT